MAQLLEVTPILPRAITSSPNVQSLAKYDAALNQGLFNILIKIAYRLNLAFMKDGSEPLTGPMIYGAPTELTIASGVVTATGSYHTIDTESDGASDDLDTINGGSDGHVLTIRANHTDRTVVAKDATGNLQLAGDMTLDSSADTLTLIYDATLAKWLETGRAGNAA